MGCAPPFWPSCASWPGPVWHPAPVPHVHPRRALPWVGLAHRVDTGDQWRDTVPFRPCTTPRLNPACRAQLAHSSLHPATSLFSISKSPSEHLRHRAPLLLHRQRAPPPPPHSSISLALRSTSMSSTLCACLQPSLLR